MSYLLERFLFVALCRATKAVGDVYCDVSRSLLKIVMYCNYSLHPLRREDGRESIRYWVGMTGKALNIKVVEFTIR